MPQYIMLLKRNETHLPRLKSILYSKVNICLPRFKYIGKELNYFASNIPPVATCTTAKNLL